jgi:hypothetical protein
VSCVFDSLDCSLRPNEELSNEKKRHDGSNAEDQVAFHVGAGNKHDGRISEKIAGTTQTDGGSGRTIRANVTFCVAWARPLLSYLGSRETPVSIVLRF